MRPRREVLLLVRDEEALSRWRMKMEIWGYRVHGHLTIESALEHLNSFPVDIVATSVEGKRGACRLAMDHGCVLLFDVDNKTAPGYAHRMEPAGPVLPERMREALKIMTARKRGPKAAEKKQPAKCAG